MSKFKATLVRGLTYYCGAHQRRYRKNEPVVVTAEEKEFLEASAVDSGSISGSDGRSEAVLHGKFKFEPVEEPAPDPDPAPQQNGGNGGQGGNQGGGNSGNQGGGQNKGQGGNQTPKPRERSNPNANQGGGQGGEGGE